MENWKRQFLKDMPLMCFVLQMRFMLLFAILSIFAAGCLYATTPILIAEENFEGTMACKLSSVGSFPIAPGIKSGMGVDGSSAYGFGRSSSSGFALWDYVNDLTFTFSKKCVITRVEFWEMERYGNFGSEGWLLANGNDIENTDFGREPVNDWVADSSFRRREFTMNVVTSSLTFRCYDITQESELFIDSIKIYGYVYDGAITVRFNANDGIGTMESQTLDATESHQLPANQFTRDGYVFLGWALAPDGNVVYRDGEEIDVDSDMTLYAVWANPALALTAESADWSSGSITLRCEDADTSGAAHKYSLEYCDESGAWVAVGGAGAANVFVGADGFARLTDSNFCSRLDGIKTLSYRVKDENGRMSEPCVTRNRYGLSVGIGQYAGYDLGLDNNVGFAVDANLCRNLALSQGGFSRFREFLDSDATATPIRSEMATLAQLAKPGDTVLFFVSAHGSNGKIHLYGSTSYSTAQIQADVEAFNSGVAVIGIIMACHSGSLLQLGSWPSNAALISSCTAKQISIIFGGGDVIPSPFGGILLQDGWEDGYADRSLFGTSWGGGNGDGIVTFDELARYAAEFSKGYSDMVASSSVQVTNRRLLEHAIAGRAGSGSSFVRPLPPTSCEATHGISDAEIQVTWAQVADPTIRRYWLFRKKPGDAKAACISRYAGSGSFSDARTIEKTTLPKTQGIPISRLAPENFVEYQYHICSVSPCGISNPSPVATGMSGTVNLQQWYSSLGYTTSTEIASARTTMASNKVNTIEECYVTGISPTDETAKFEARIVIGADGKPVVKWSPDLNENGTKTERVYRVLGAKELGAAAQWDNVTDLQDYGAEQGYRFFKVDVELL